MTDFLIRIGAKDEATGVVGKVGRAFSHLSRPIAGTTRAVKDFAKPRKINKLGHAVSELGNAATDTAGKVLSISPAMTGLIEAASVAGSVSLAARWGDHAQKLSNLNAITGVSTRNLQAMSGAATAAGVSGDAMVGSLGQLGAVMQDAAAGRNETAVSLFNRLGLVMHRTKSGAMDSVNMMKQVSDALRHQTNPQVRGKILSTLGIDKSLLPLLDQGAAGIAKLEARARSVGDVMSRKDVAAGTRFHQSLNLLGMAATGVGNRVGADLEPVLTTLASGLTSFIAKNQAAAKYMVEAASAAAAFGAAVKGAALAQGLLGISLSGVALKAATMTESLAALAEGVPLVGAALEALSGGFLAVGAAIEATPVGWIITAIAAVAAVAFGAYELVKHWKGVAAFFRRQWDGMRHVVTDFVEWFEHIPAYVAHVGERVGASLAHGVRNGLAHAWGAVESVGRDVGAAASSVAHRVEGAFGSNKAQRATGLKAMAYFEGHGWTRAQAAGIVANLQRESRFNPGAVGDHGAAYGIGQWHPDRQADYIAYAKAHHLKHLSIRGSSLTDQLGFVNWELHHKEAAAGAKLKASATPGRSGAVFSKYDERPAATAQEEVVRAASARRWAKLASAAGTTAEHQVTVHVAFANAPPGMTAKARVNGHDKPVRIGHSMAHLQA